MKTIGLIGGMSWEASARYYRLINEGISKRFGGLHSADMVMVSVDFHKLERLQQAGRWIEASQLIGIMGESLENAGVDFVAICSVTGHQNIAFIALPVLHIVDCINVKIKGLKKVGLLGTKYTMEMGYFKDKINAEVIIPDDCDEVNDIIYKKLCLGRIRDSSRAIFKIIIDNMISEGAKGIILGCTELGLLVKQENYDIPIFDSTIIHAKAIVEYACSGLHNL